MSVRIAHASISENGSVNGKAGDQNGNEVCIRTWYNRPWNYVIRCKDVVMREKIAWAIEQACINDNIGYSQNSRNTLLTYARKVNYDPSKVTEPCNTDCSALVSLACIYAGIDEDILVKSGNSSTTSTLRNRLKLTGKFEVLTDDKYTKSSDLLLRGDILLYEGRHVAVAIDNGSKVNSYIRNGLNYALIFDPVFYSNRYEDLKKAFGSDSNSLFKHFLAYGMSEGRQAISTFNAYAYKDRYIDLQNAFGDDIKKYYEHYLRYGYRENRKTI